MATNIILNLMAWRASTRYAGAEADTTDGFASCAYCPAFSGVGYGSKGDLSLLVLSDLNPAWQSFSYHHSGGIVHRSVAQFPSSYINRIRRGAYMHLRSLHHADEGHLFYPACNWKAFNPMRAAHGIIAAHRALMAYATISAYASAILFSFYNIAIAIMAFAIATMLFVYAVKPFDYNISAMRSGVASMLNSMSKNSPSASSIKSIMSSLPDRFPKSGEIRRSANLYMLTGSAGAAFSGLSKSENAIIRKLGIMLSLHFSVGSNLPELSKNMLRQELWRKRLRSQALPILGNSKTMSLTGLNIFFPVFGGVIINVIRFSQFSQSSGAGIAALPALVFFLAYVVFADIITFHGDGKPDSRSMLSALQWASVGALVLNASYIASLSII